MTTAIDVKMTPQGLLIPREAIDKWLNQGIEVVKDQNRIIIQPKLNPLTEHAYVLQVLESSGLLLEPDLEATAPPVSATELADLAEKFSSGRPLSEIVIEEREEGW